MKKIVFFFALFLTMGYINGQSDDSQPNTYIADAKGTVRELWDKTMEWVTATSSDTDITIVDPEFSDAKMLGKGIESLEWNWKLNFNIRLDFKDNKVRVIFSDENITSRGMDITGQFAKDYIPNHEKAIFDSLIAYYQKKEPDKNW